MLSGKLTQCGGSMEYEAAFRAAFNRTVSWKLYCDGVEVFRLGVLTGAPAPPSELVEMFLMGMPTRPGMHKDCGGAHTSTLMSMLLQGWPSLPVLTIGEVLVDGNPRFGVCRQSLRAELRRPGDRSTPMQFHVWLTFPDLTIWDATFIRAMRFHAESACSGLPEGQRDTFVGPPERLAPTLVYRPWLLGEQFLIRAKALEPQMVTYLMLGLREVREMLESAQ